MSRDRVCSILVNQTHWLIQELLMSIRSDFVRPLLFFIVILYRNAPAGGEKSVSRSITRLSVSFVCIFFEIDLTNTIIN